MAILAIQSAPDVNHATRRFLETGFSDVVAGFLLVYD
jgi:hypothetical protein